MTDVRKAASNAEVGDGDLVEMAAQLRGRAAWYDDVRPGSVKTPQLLRQAADLLDGRRAALAPKEGAPAADLEAVHDVAIQAYEAALGGPYSANALRKAVDAALEAAAPFLPAQAAEPVADEDAADVEAATSALAEYERDGGVSLEQLEAELFGSPLLRLEQFIAAESADGGTDTVVSLCFLREIASALALSGAAPFLPAQAAPVAWEFRESYFHKEDESWSKWEDDWEPWPAGTPHEESAFAGTVRRQFRIRSALSLGAAPQAGEDAKPEQWGDETVIADWWLIQNKHGQIIRGERTKDAAVNLDGGLWEGDIIIPVKRAGAAPPVEGWRPIGEDHPAPPHDQPVLLYSPPSTGSPAGKIEARPFSTGRSGPGWSEYSQHSWATHWMPLPTTPDSQGGEDAAD